MSLLQIYWRALGYLAADKKRVALICAANVALAAIAILEPILFGRVIGAISEKGPVPAHAIRPKGIFVRSYPKHFQGNSPPSATSPSPNGTSKLATS
ncbi:hypothetical protein [Mesorhizobium sp. WSM3626]|uniref:hypothetical protein n=1 Tax=Mesorhizobium sp. WSM3626 TaxID=1040987 RepID=UPI0004B2CC0B|nr:hypothetical protein [Mesorhizobium sp. WSM3626]